MPIYNKYYVLFNFICMDTQTKLKAENDLLALYKARFVLRRYVHEHNAMLKHSDFVDVSSNRRYLKTLKPSLRTINKLIRLFETEYLQNF